MHATNSLQQFLESFSDVIIFRSEMVHLPLQFQLEVVGHVLQLQHLCTLVVATGVALQVVENTQ